jgi:hypothetical protein
MGTSVGVGYSESLDSKTAGIEAAKAAMLQAGTATDKCDLAILFSTPRQDSVRLRDGVRTVVGEKARLIGGTVEGIATNDHFGRSGYQVGVAVLSSDTIKVSMFLENELPDAEYDVGVALGQQITKHKYDGQPNILLIYDSVKQTAQEGHPALNLATPLIQGLSHVVQTRPPIAGIGLLGDGQFFHPACQWFDSRIERQSAMALVLSGGVRMDTLILHGCRPSSGYHTITKAQHNIIYEIDGKPALDMISELLGPDSNVGWEDFPLYITFGVNKGERFGEFKEEDYANRLCLAIDKESRALIMFEPDLKPGDEVQLMRRSIDFEYIGPLIKDFLKSIDSRKPLFAFYIDCLGRASEYSGYEQEEIENVQKQIGSTMPFLGVYSGVEIARVGEDVQALDWTGVLCVFSE